MSMEEGAEESPPLSDITPSFQSQLATTNGSCDPLEPSRFLFVRYCFIGIFGFSICVIGIVMNVILLTILSKRGLRTTYLIYLAALAVLDIAVAITYIMVMCVSVIYDYLENIVLYHIWYTFLPYFFTLSRIVTLASTYMVLVCTAERLLEVLHLSRHCEVAYKVKQKTRYSVIALVITLSAAFRLVVFWELKVVKNEACRGTFNYYNLTQTWLVKDFYYSKVYSFWILHFVQVFFPFGALLLLNAMIVKNWRFALRRASTYTADEITKRVRAAQSARKMMAAIVASYLVCNLLNLIVTFMEHIDSVFLQRHDVFYSFSADVVTMLTAVNASFRLPIYYASNFKIRSEIRYAVKPIRTAGVYERASLVWRRISVRSVISQGPNDANVQSALCTALTVSELLTPDQTETV